VDVKFILTAGDEPRAEKTIALPHPDLLRVSREIGRKMDDAWCARLAAMHLKHLVETGEDIEKDLVTVPYEDLKLYAAELARQEESEVRAIRA
jgi:hypothetical protein